MNERKLKASDGLPPQPEMRYYLIDEGRFTKEALEEMPFLTAILFRMEHPVSPEEIVRAGEDVAAWFKNHPDGPPVKQLFVELIMAGLERMKVTPLSTIPDDLQEVVIMLAARVEQWAQEYEWKGQQKGEQIGEAKILTRLLQRRFGPLPDWAQEQISKADSGLLETWSIQIFDAQSLEEVFTTRA
ncbi:MAG: DUF4351 domain-containing protein [Magnetococcales bacterium]|nr:DUF4351 domain-containing protein [Magnetococcales bacterium]NGZ06904.1 DUF4351 domain-containing protein [Magnetococcales bacterium]